MKNGTHLRKAEFDLGLYLSGATCPPGARRTCQEIADFIVAAGGHCSPQRIQQIESRALRKLRHPSNLNKLT